MSRLHIVAIAALGCLTFGWALTGSRPWLVAAVCALDWFLVNLMNRVADLQEDRINGIVGTELVARRQRPILLGGGLLLFGSLGAVHLVYPALTPWRVAGHLWGAIYNFPVMPGRRRLKTLYFWKNMASGLAFVLTVLVYPLAAAGWRMLPDVDAATVAWSIAFFLPFELAYEVIYDLRDAPGDARAGVRSYPVVHGERASVHIADSLLGVSIAAATAGWLLGPLPWRVFVMIIGPLFVLVTYKRALGRGITARDCVALTWLGAGLLAAYHVWEALGLPGTGGGPLQ